MRIILIPLHVSRRDVCETLARNGRLDALRYAIESGYPHKINTLCRSATACGHVNVLKYLRDYAGVRFTSITSSIAARFGQVKSLDYILKVRGGINKRHVTSLYRTAALHGHLSIVKYLYENRYECFENICNVSAPTGHLDMLKYAHIEMKFPYTPWTAASPAGSNNLDCLIYLHESGCPWDEWTCILLFKREHTGRRTSLSSAARISHQLPQVVTTALPPTARYETIYTWCQISQPLVDSCANRLPQYTYATRAFCYFHFYFFFYPQLLR